ncbi:MFS transporter [Oceanispirochaeta sp.]|jgi:PPP family 3-phenylpropionic acid transporter|uniref:MFS transporter n=1 Tax=Oceanispirochaeta sp. TaxID=2035350 RepID=UPI002632D459|nr:MFS transporter [Oceanispirochaeta sp.]MDA3957251.1 MFS transporter [Oceanispirochaeta sp.]
MIEAKKYQNVYKLVYFFLFGSIASLYPFFPLVLQSKGFEPSRIGFVMGSYEFVSILGLLIIGHFYDRIRSPRRTIVTIILLCLLTLFLIVRAQSLLLVVPLTLGLGFVIKSPTSLVDAHYGQTMPNSQEKYGKTRLYGSLGFFCVAMLIQITNWVEASRPISVFLGFSILMVIAIPLIIYLPAAHLAEDQQKPVSFLKTIKTFPGIYWIGLSIASLNFMGISGHITFFSLLLKNKFATEDISGFWAIGPLFEVPLFFFSGFLLRKLGLKRLWLLCLAAGVLRMQVYSFSRTLLPLYIVQILHSISFGFNHLAMVTLISRATSNASRGLAMSLYSAIGMGFSLFVGGFLGGWILGYSDYPFLFQVFSLFPLLGMGIILLFLRGKQLEKMNEESSEDFSIPRGDHI